VGILYTIEVMRATDYIKDHFRLMKAQESALKRLEIETIQNLLFYFPARYDSIADVRSISELSKEKEAVIYGKLTKLKAKKTWKSRTPSTEGYIEDASGKVKIIWFNQPYIAKMHPEGSYVKLTGKITGGENGYLANPKVERASPLLTSANLMSNAGEGTIFPVYPETKGIRSGWFYHALKRVFENGLLEKIKDPIPEEILKKYNLPTLKTALVWIHTPKKELDAMAARKRFAFEEIFLIQLAQQRKRIKDQERKAFKIDVDQDSIKEFTRTPGFISC